jgi:hypothetical protein
LFKNAFVSATDKYDSKFSSKESKREIEYEAEEYRRRKSVLERYELIFVVVFWPFSLCAFSALQSFTNFPVSVVQNTSLLSLQLMLVISSFLAPEAVEIYTVACNVFCEYRIMKK